MELDQLEIDTNKKIADELIKLPFDKVKEVYLDLCDVIGVWQNDYEYAVLTARKKMIEDLVRRYKGIIWYNIYMKYPTLIFTKNKMFSWAYKNEFLIYKRGKMTYHFRKLIEGSIDDYYNAVFTACNDFNKYTLIDSESNIHKSHEKGLYLNNE